MADMTTDITTTDKMTTAFKLEDIKIGSTVMAGRATSGRQAQGTVTAVIPGVCIHVDNGVQPSALWGDFAIVAQETEAEAEAEVEEGELPPAPALRRTDSGADYGMPGYPDCEFWEAQGIEPVFVATADRYRDGNGTASALLEEHHPEEDSAAGRAWKRQLASVRPAVTTPPQSPKAAPVCPGAPSRLNLPRPVDELPRVPALVIPTIDDHRGRGILAGDWIKPDPVMTRQETRRYVIAETERWLTGRICRHAQDLALAENLPTATVEAEVAEGTWPAGRLYLVAEELEGTDIVPPSADPAIWYHTVGAWAAGVCADHLNGYEAGCAAAWKAVGFVTTDRLPSGVTIDSFWNHSPFAALRDAPPLPDTDTEEGTETPTQPDTEEIVRPSLDAPLDSIDDAVRAFMAKPLQLTLYGWQWTALVGVVTVYMWLVVLLLSRR